MNSRFFTYLDYDEPKRMLSQTVEIEELIGNGTISSFHSHSYMELIYVVRGNSTFMMNSRAYPASQDCAALFPPQVRHQTIVDLDSQHYRRYVIRININYIHHLLLYAHCNPDQFPIFSNTVFISAETSKRYGLSSTLNKLLTAFESSDQFRSSELDCCVLYLLMSLRHIVIGESQDETESSSFRLISDIAKYIREEFTSADFCTESILQAFPVSKSNLSRLFRKYTGMSVHQYIIWERLEYSRHCMEQGANAMEACMACGFSNYSTYLKAYKKIYDSTPMEYRKNNYEFTELLGSQ